MRFAGVGSSARQDGLLAPGEVVRAGSGCRVFERVEPFELALECQLRAPKTPVV